MDEAALRTLLDDVRSGALAPDEAVTTLRRLPYADLGYARVDHHRTLRQGRPEAAIDYQERAVTICREIEHRHGETLVLARYAAADVQAGRPLHAIGLLEQALRLANRLGTRPIEMIVLNGLGEALLAGGRADRAPEQHTAALELAERMGDVNEQARSHHGLARTQAALGHTGTAERHAKTAYALYAELGVPEAEQVRAQFPTVAAPNGSAPAGARK